MKLIVKALTKAPLSKNFMIMSKKEKEITNVARKGKLLYNYFFVARTNGDTVQVIIKKKDKSSNRIVCLLLLKSGENYLFLPDKVDEYFRYQFIVE